MIAFDADVLSLILSGDPKISRPESQISLSEQALSIIVVEENEQKSEQVFPSASSLR